MSYREGKESLIDPFLFLTGRRLSVKQIHGQGFRRCPVEAAPESAEVFRSQRQNLPRTAHVFLADFSQELPEIRDS
jgi:hypothetical protein